MRQHNVSLSFSVKPIITIASHIIIVIITKFITAIINCETFYVLLSTRSASDYEAGKVNTCVGHISVSMITPHYQTQRDHCFTATNCRQ